MLAPQEIFIYAQTYLQQENRLGSRELAEHLHLFRIPEDRDELLGGDHSQGYAIDRLDNQNVPGEIILNENSGPIPDNNSEVESNNLALNYVKPIIPENPDPNLRI